MYFLSPVIPALQSIVHDLFVLRCVNKADAGKDVDTQREVVIAMLLKLIKHHQASVYLFESFDFNLNFKIGCM